MTGPISRRKFLAGVALGGAAVGAVGIARLTGTDVPLAPGLTGFTGLAGGSTPELLPTRDWNIKPVDSAPAKLAEFYAGRTSVLPGETVPLHVSTSADEFTVEAFRIGDYEGLGGALVAKIGPFKGSSQNAPKQDPDTRAMTAGWHSNAEISTQGWPAGLYVLHIVAAGKRVDTPLVVRSESADGALAIIGSATTWQAYNLWGGRSLYRKTNGGFDERSYAVSFDRPYLFSGGGLPSAFEIPVARVADEAGVPIAWFANTDITADPALLQGAKGAVSTGHDEYWPVAYRNALVDLRDSGGNLAFLGANAGYWRARVDESEDKDPRLVTCYKSSTLDPIKNDSETTARWRDAPDPRPESEVVGQLYDAFPAYGAMRVRDPDFFLFEGTGAREGSKYPGVLGPEIDRFYPNHPPPGPMQIAALSDTTCRGKGTWSTMGYYTCESGAAVWSSGTMGWCRSLPRPSAFSGITRESTDFTHQVTLNAFKAMAQGPLGSSHPARDDSNDVNLPDTNTTGAA